MSTKIFLYDTTLRDGAQSEDVNLSATDKVRIARQLDYLGMDYIEGGWPGANPVETEFFKAMKDVELRNAKLAAFGSTHHPSIRLGHRMMVVRVPDEAVCPEESKTTPPKDAGFDR